MPPPTPGPRSLNNAVGVAEVQGKSRAAWLLPHHDRHAMKTTPLQTYFFGQGAILMGAWGMDASGSMWPMALGASAGLMCTAPLVRQLLARWRASRSR